MHTISDVGFFSAKSTHQDDFSFMAEFNGNRGRFSFNINIKLHVLLQNCFTVCFRFTALGKSKNSQYFRRCTEEMCVNECKSEKQSVFKAKFLLHANKRLYLPNKTIRCADSHTHKHLPAFHFNIRSPYGIPHINITWVFFFI